MKKPNILFLMSDEHRADVTGYEGNKIVRTPNLDNLAANGAVFTNCYTPSPVCIPARQAMMAGQHCKTCGCVEFVQDLAPFYNTFARWLSKYGYFTCACGKLHHQGIDQMQGWTQRIGGDIRVADQFIEREKGVHTDWHRQDHKWTDTKEVQRAGVGRHHENFDDYAVEGAINFIHDYFSSEYFDRPMGEQPLLLKVSLLKPHYPYQTTDELFSYYLNRVEPYLEKETFQHGFLSQRRVELGVDANEREFRRATAAYYGMIEQIDRQYGQVLQALQEVGQDLDDWLIVYTSDHGEMLGQHGIWEKQKFFEASVRVPLILYAPKRFGKVTVEENVSACDLYATLCDFAGVPVPDHLESDSLLPLTKGTATDWDDEVISHFQTTMKHEPNLMIKRGNLKYQSYGGLYEEVLFDLERDPEERENFMKDEKYQQQILSFRERASELGYKY